MGGERQRLLAETMDSPGKPATPSAPATAANATPPVDAPQSSGPPPFLTKTYEMVDDPSTHSIVSWSSANTSFVVWNPPEFAQELLPKYFKHNNFSSFVRQLNTYGFRKVDPDRWEFANEGFLRGRRDLLRTIHRRKPAAHPAQQQGAFVEVGKFGLEAEIEKLKRDKNSLMLELVRVRQQQQNTERELQLTTHRLQMTELRQQSMISFLAKAMLNPSFFAQFVSQQNEEIHVMRKKRRLPVHADEGDMDDSISPESSIENQMVTFQRSGLGEDGARDMLYQMFFPADSPPAIDTNHFDGRVREMDVTHGGVNGVNRQSGVTLKEITTKFPNIYSSVPIVTDVSTPEAQESTPVAQPFDNTRVSGGNGSEDDGGRYPHSEHRDSDVAGGNGSEDGSGHPQSEHRDSNVPGGNGSEDGSGHPQSEHRDSNVPGGNGSEDGSRYPQSEHRDSDETVEADGNRDTVCHEAEVQSARTDTSRADTATYNSGFWSQYLTEEDPRPCTDTALRLEREVQFETQNLFQDDKKACPESPGVDILSHQLGQLAPG